ncbi:PREDICTED: coiled-coil domain-containing protein 157 isoform X1 [Cyprinodon variegatus]|nr:PREDICTED: coiled-coil domain-containing protein 157 isoform X1 [Cyprinodon variegatus]
MTELLGRENCIKNLRKDLVDIQVAIEDVLSRTGPVHYTSWKSPDKLACSLDMVALLEEYDFVNGEDAYNQHSHVVLLELVVDRLLLLLQSVGAFTELQKGRYRRDQSQQKGCLSVGLVVRNYWGNLLQYANTKENSKDIKQIKTKALDTNQKKVSSPSSPTSSGSDFCRNCASTLFCPTSFKFPPENHTSSGPDLNASSCSKIQRHSAACQTVESLLVPCDACYRVQSLLRNTGDALIDLFQSEGLPSALQPLLDAMQDTVDPGKMTAGDVALWAKEQLRDMRRLGKHLQDVRSTVEPLREALRKAESERDGFSSQLVSVKKEFKEEVEKHQANIVQLELALQKAQRSSKETEQRLQEEHKQLKREMLSLEENNTRLKEKVELQLNMLQALEDEKEMQRDEEAYSKLQQRILELETHLSDTKLLLDKEKAKYQSACCRQESMQAKQQSLLERVDALDEECDELQKQLEEKEDAQSSLNKRLQDIYKLKEQQEAQLSQQQDIYRELQREKQTLQTHADELEKRVAQLTEHVNTLRERERLLVLFPELNDWAQTQPQSTGNLILDMEQQQQANSLRIKLLEQENATLQKSLEKLRQRQIFNSTRVDPPRHTK